MYFYILASGSDGNCSVIGTKNTQIIIDCGSTQKYLKNAFSQLDVDYTKVNGILLTHSHSDHVKQLKMFSALDVYSPFTVCGVKKYHEVFPLGVFKIGDLTIMPIPLSHDTDITVGYIIFDGQETLVYLTDTGYIRDENMRLIRNATYYIFESNHDPELLMKTTRPYMTKQRIAGDRGHLSNDDAALALTRSISTDTKEIILAHISKEANTYQLAYDTTRAALEDCGLFHENLKLKAIKQFEIYKGGNYED